MRRPPTAPRPRRHRIVRRRPTIALAAVGLSIALTVGCSATGSDGARTADDTSTTTVDGATTSTTAPPTTGAPPTTTTRPELVDVDPAAYLLPPAAFGNGWTLDPDSAEIAASDGICPSRIAVPEVLDEAEQYLLGPGGTASGGQNVRFHVDDAEAQATLDLLGDDLARCDGPVDIDGRPATLEVTAFDPGDLGDARIGYRYDINIDDQLLFAGYEVAYRQGPLVSSVALVGNVVVVDRERIEALAREAAARTAPAIGG